VYRANGLEIGVEKGPLEDQPGAVQGAGVRGG
jgi:hypothetical protein